METVGRRQEAGGSESAFEDFLRENRATLNARFEAARAKSPALDGASFLAHLSTRVARIVEAIHTHDQTRSASTAFALYDVSLELFGKNLLGAAPRSPLAPCLWESLFPAIEKFLSKPVLRALVNAALGIENTPGARGRVWIEEMSTLALSCNNGDDFLDAGQILAWRCGLAHLRSGALQTARELAQKNEALARGTLGITPSTPLETAISSYEGNPWFQWAPAGDGKPKIRKVIGGFCGLEKDRKVGAVFSAPPHVCFHHGNFYAFDEENIWLFFADSFGASFHRIGTLMEFSGDPHAPNYSPMVEESAGIPELSNPSSVARGESTLAVTLPHSHAIYLVA